VKYLLLLSLLGASALAPTASGQVSQLPAQAKPVQGILVPVPKEIFKTLDKFDDANWSAVQRPEIAHWKSHGDQVQVALLLGVTVAEGFVAMETKDSAGLHDLGNSVLHLARGLGVGERALRRSKSITDYTDRKDWKAARKEWGAVLADLEKGLIDLKSEPLSQLVSLAGWLRGTEALCDLVLQRYSPAHAELIRQPAVVDYLKKQLVGMQNGKLQRAVSAQMLRKLREIRRLIENDKAPLDKTTVRKIRAICSQLVLLSSQRPA
jgi:hypothetical protein